MRQGESLGPLSQWPGTKGLILAGRIASMLGSNRLGDALHIRAHRQSPEDPSALSYFLATRLRRLGSYAAWESLDQQRRTQPESTFDHPDVLLFEARLKGLLRDFDTAEDKIARAEALSPEDPWVPVERSMLLELSDRYEEALLEARRALTLRPWYGAAVLQCAQQLQILSREEEATLLLKEALSHTENAFLAGQLSGQQFELRQYKDAHESLDRFEELSPLLDKVARQWLWSRRSDIHYKLGDLPSTIRAAKKANNPFHEKIVERLEATNGTPPAVSLDVSFLRQNHMTCGPATLSMLSQFFGRPADHLSVADKISYGGTSYYNQRHWANSNGFKTREFTLNIEDARKLLQMGIPIAVSTVECTSAHMQIITGHDPRLGVFIVRDPYLPHSQEFLDLEFLERYQVNGPRCLAIAPEADPDPFGDTKLLDSSLYDLLFQIESALHVHDRDEAFSKHRKLTDQDPHHRITIEGRYALSGYEADDVGMLVCLDRLLELYPENEWLVLRKVSCLQSLGRVKERLAILSRKSEDPSAHPVFLQQLAQELSADARSNSRTHRLLRRSLRLSSGDAHGLFLKGFLLWNEREFDRAIELYRYAACLEETNEYYSQTYFAACRSRGMTELVLKFLRGRFERFASKSANPAKSLFEALDQLERTSEGFDVLEAAVSAREDDPDLLLYCAQVYARFGKFDRSEELLSRSEGIGKETDRLMTTARIAFHQGHLEESEQSWRNLLALEPLNLEAHHELCTILELIGGREMVLSHFKETTETYPFHRPLSLLHAQWLAPKDPAAAEILLARILVKDPSNSLARRERALRLIDLGRFQEAMEEAAHSCRLEPTSAKSHAILGHALAQVGRTDDAVKQLHIAIGHSVDEIPAIQELMLLQSSDEDRRTSLAIIRTELESQVSSGDGILAYWSQVTDVLSDEEVHSALKEIAEQRPDLWQAWSALSAQLLAMKQPEQAFLTAKEATEKFPLTPQLWLDFARSAQALANHQGAEKALKRAVSINPTWIPPLLMLAEHYEEHNNPSRARELRKETCALGPQDPLNHLFLANLEFKLGNTDEAIAGLETALCLDPNLPWAQSTLETWAMILARPDLPETVARRVLSRQEDDPSRWILLMKCLPQSLPEERVRAITRAIDLDPLREEAYDLAADLLAEQGDLDGAMAVCEKLPFEERRPAIIEGRIAWIEAQQGNFESAITRIKEVLSTNPHYQRGWSNLADWLEHTGQRDEHLATTKQMTVISPRDPTSHAYHGTSLLEIGEISKAKAAFTEAIRLAPDYAYAGGQLFELYVAEKDFDAAEQILLSLEESVDESFVHVRFVHWAAVKGDTEVAEDRFRRLCLDPTASELQLVLATEILQQNSLSTLMGETLDAVVQDPDVHPAVAGLWITTLGRGGDWTGCERGMDSLRDRDDLARAGARAHLEVLSEMGERKRLCKWIDSNRDWLREKTDTWSATGLALAEQALRDRAADWLSNWREKEDVDAAILSVLVAVLRHKGRSEEAAQISLAALELPEDESSDIHRLWLASDSLLLKDFESVERILAKRPPEGLDQYYKFIDDLVRGMLAGIAEKSTSREAFGRGRVLLKKVCRDYPGFYRHRPLRRLFSGCARIIARRRGTLLARIWGTLRGVFVLRRFL